MAHYEKRKELVCKRTESGRWRGQEVFDLINQQKIQKLVVVLKERPPEEPRSGWPHFTVSLYTSERAASEQPYPDDDLYLVMLPLESGDGRVRFFDIAGYTFQDCDTPLTEVFGNLRVVIECEGPDEAPVFLVAVGGDVPGAVTHGATVCLA